MNNNSRAYTKDEIISNLLTYLHDDVPEICRKSFGEDYSAEDVVFTVLGTLDGETIELPGFRIIPVVGGKEEDDIGGELHSLIFRKDEELKELLASETISKSEYSFVAKMKDLAANCSRDMVVPEILKTIDLGVTEDYINYTRFNFEPIPHQDDIDIAIERGTNYYPMNAPNISGQLAKTYDTLYSNKKTTQEEKAPSAVTEEKV